MTATANKSLQEHVDRIAALNAQIQEAQWEIKEVADAAFGKGLVATDHAGTARKIVKQLAKDQAKDADERAKQREYEELLDDCRAALGLLADTPLGEAASQQVRVGDPADLPSVSKRSFAPTQKVLNGANGAAEPAKRARGRPKGSKNKPKAPGGEWSRPPQQPEPPPVPDFTEPDF